MPLSDDRGAESAVAEQTALADLVESLRRLRSEVDHHEITAGTQPAYDGLRRTMQTLYTLMRLGHYRLIAVAGGQGAGKTTLMRNLYPSAAGFLTGNITRGEKTPLIVVETAGRTRPRGVAVRLARGSAQPAEEAFDADRVAEWTALARGSDPDVLMLRLEVAPEFWEAPGTGFVLLPGYERGAQVWQQLTRMVVATSRAAIIVADGSQVADATQRAIMTDIWSSVAGGESRTGLVVALSRLADATSDAVAATVGTATEVYQVPASAVIVCGRDRDQPADWVQRLHTLLERVLPTAAQTRRYRVDLLRECVRVDVRGALGLATVLRNAITLKEVATPDTALLNRFLAAFDAEADEVLRILERDVDEVFDAHFVRARNALATEIGETGVDEAFDLGWDFLTLDPSGKHRRRQSLVLRLWNSASGAALQREALDLTVAKRLRYHGARLNDATLAALREMDVTALDDFDNAVQLLPTMALEARGIAVGFADADGAIAIPAPGAGQALQRSIPTADSQRLLSGLADVLKLNVDKGKALDALSFFTAATSQLATPRLASAGIAAGAGTAALGAAGAGAGTAAIGAAGAATTGAGAAVAGVATGSSVPAAAAGGAAVAGTALSATLVASAGVAAAVFVLQMGNLMNGARATRAEAELSACHVAAKAHALRTAQELLASTRRVLADRLTDKLRLNEPRRREVGLAWAASDVARAQEALLELLRDDLA